MSKNVPFWSVVSLVSINMSAFDLKDDMFNTAKN